MVRRPEPVATPAPTDEWLESVSVAAAAACRAPADLLGEYLPMLADAAIHGRRPASWQLDAIRALGRRAAESEVDAGRAVDLYLSATWRLWRELPTVARSSDPEKVRNAATAVLRVLDDAIGVLVDGHQSQRRDMIRREEAQRAAFVDDLLRGDADVSSLVERAEPFGIDLGKRHSVTLITAGEPGSKVEQTAAALERIVVEAFGDREVLVAIKDGRIVAIVPAGSNDGEVGSTLKQGLARRRITGRWRLATGRGFPGAYGIARSYEEAREALEYADRLNLDDDLVHARDLLVYRVLGRDQAAIVDLVRDVLGPLHQMRGGATIALETLQEYFATGAVATDTARRLHVSVRTVTYRLARIAQLTGYHAAHADQRFTLQAAVLGARLLDWPTVPLPSDTE
ncbi:PucR family transcriptional regulator [Cryptosporangium minutisporangium]|uniref:Helix-turn-helix domain-containing protein n=1 Tax=Cryptosporangium minutisporangium TaxID=113569 RepID=A0ABP6STI5_9ACTN